MVVEVVRGILPIAIGITNQRETAAIWDRATGKHLQCHRLAGSTNRRRCAVMKHAGKEAMVKEKTGLLLDLFHGPQTCLDTRPGRWRT